MTFAVLHVTSMPGGGVNRHIDDIARADARPHLVWHVAEGADVIAAPGPLRYFPLGRGALVEGSAALANWLRSRGVGLVHVHSIATAPRARAEWAVRQLGVPFVATLHDVLFLRRDGFEPGASRDPDPAWLAQSRAFLARAAARIAPSEFLADLARRHLGEEVLVVPNGSAPPSPDALRCEARPEFLARKPAHVAAIVGAIGPHKGARVLEEASALLAASDIAIVVIGYLDKQLTPGWRGERLFIHGAWNDADVRGLAAAYGAEIAIFPHRVPESFSYALSDAWAAGLPALVAPDGALGERVARHGGGWLLPEGFEAADVVAALRRIFSPEGARELAEVKSRLSGNDSPRVPPLDAMNRSLDMLYARYGIEPGAAVDPLSAPAQSLLAANIDGAIMRPEMAQLADELSQLKHGLEVERGQAARFEAEAREWIAKLEADIAALQDELRREVAERQRLAAENEQLRLRPKFVRRLASLARRLAKKKSDARG